MTLRVNQRRGTTAEYLAQLGQLDLPARQIEPDALQLDKPVSVDKLPGFFAGLVSVQDAVPNTRQACWMFMMVCVYWMPAPHREARPRIFWSALR